jgi:hypothetical protein
MTTAQTDTQVLVSELQRGTIDMAEQQVSAPRLNGTSVPSPRKGLRVGPVSELSVFLKVKPGREQIIREAFNPAPAQRAALEKAINDVGTLHQARYVLFDNGTRLLVATTFDGDWDVYIDDFAASYVLDAWDRFLIHCEGYPDEGKASLTVEEIKEFLTANQVTAADFSMQYPGVTVKQVQQALRVKTAFQQVLDTPSAAEALQHPALKPLLELAAD